MADEQARKDFFISYTGADRSWAEWMAWQLEQANYSVILQAWDFRPGGNFVLDMDQASKQCDRTIAVLSADYFKSKYTPSEWAAAFRQDPLSRQLLLLPVRVRDCDIEGLLGQIVYIDLVGKDEQAARLALLAGVSRERAKPTTPPAFPMVSFSLSQPPAFPGVLPSIWTVPSLRNPYFTGREEPLQQLVDAFEGHGAAGMRQPVALSGLGGIGKTQIAIEFAYRFSARYQAVLWAQANTTQADIAHADTRAVLVSSFLRIADSLNLPEKNEQDANNVVQAVKRWLQTQSGWLLILDNADGLALAREFLPATSAGHVLITTRAEVTAPLARRLGIDVLTTELGARFLLLRAGLLAPELPLEQASVVDQALARQLCDEMGGLPLALDQAGAYIQENACRLSDYLEWYRERRTILLRERGGLGDEHPEPVATTWSLSFDQVEHNSVAAADLLRLCAFLHPDAIPQELITEGMADLGPPLEPLGTDPLALNAALKELRAYSLVRRDPSTQTLSLHRLVQAVLKDSMKEQTQREWAERSVRAVDLAFPDVTNVALREQCERYLPHALVCATLIEAYSFEFAEASRLLNQTAYYLDRRAQYAQAEPLYQRALAINEQQLGPEHPDTARSLNNLAALYYTQGKYEQVEPLYQRALAINEQQLGPEHPDTAGSLNNLAALYYTQGKYEQAEPFYQRALAINEKQLGPEHPDTATCLNNLANLYHAQGKYEQAEPLLQQALAIMEQQLGPEHPDTARSLNNLANLYHAQGKYEQAEPLYQRALTIREQQLGPEHPDTARSLNDLAELYHAQGEYEQAEPLYQRALAINEKQLGPEHPNTATSLNNLAELYLEQAEPLYQRALATYEQQLGPENPDTARSLNDLAELYRAQGKYQEAEPLYQRALAINEQQLGPEHPNTATSLNNLAELYRAQGEYEQAEPLYQRALATYEQQLGPEHPDTATSLNNLAVLYRAQGKYQEAEPLILRALTIREQQLGPEHPDTATSLNDLAGLLYAQGKYEQAEPLYQQALAICEQQLGPEHPNTAGSLNNLALLYRTQGKYAQAKPLYQRAVMICEQQLGPEHPTTMIIRENYKTLIRNMKRKGKEQH
jgi:tetratricopeptide (TPR) repeat protein